MNDVATIPEKAGPVLPPKPQMTSGAKPMGIVPQSIEEVARIANVAISAGLMGKPTQRDTAEQKLPRAMMIIMTGMELGITPMQALNGMANINGKVGPYGKLARSLVLRRGHKIHDMFVGEPYEPDYRAVCTITRGDNGASQTREFSVADAVTAGLWQTSPTMKKKDWDSGKMVDAPNDSPWFRYQKDMLAARAFSRASTIVSDALMGMEIVEVLRDIDDREEDRGAVRSEVVAAPPPPLAAEIEARKPPVDDPAPSEPERKPSPPTPAEEEVPEHAVETAIKGLAAAFTMIKTLDGLEAELEAFNTEYDGHITEDMERRIAELYEARLAKL